jgi:hypothetical protein
LRPVRTLLFYAQSPESSTLSYQTGWPRAFARHPRFDCTLVNVLGSRRHVRTRLGGLLRPRAFDAVVALHSVFSNVRYFPGNLARAVRRLPVPKVYFIGNEYKLMPQKLAFCDELGIDLLVSQFTTPAPLELYRRHLSCRVAGLPNTGFDPDLFAARVPVEERSIDLGYRAHRNGFELGHQERSALVERFRAAADEYGLNVDVSLDPRGRFDEEGWAAFLNRCKGQVGSEAGGDYFELTDETAKRVQAHLREHPDASFEDVFERFFRGYADPVPGRALSGRVVEAAATRAVQILLEGEYGGYFRAGVHYIPLRKDFSNLDQAIAEFRDDRHAEAIRDEAHALVCEHLTYPKLLERFHAELAPLLE